MILCLSGAYTKLCILSLLCFLINIMRKQKYQYLTVRRMYFLPRRILSLKAVCFRFISLGVFVSLPLPPSLSLERNSLLYSVDSKQHQTVDQFLSSQISNTFQKQYKWPDCAKNLFIHTLPTPQTEKLYNLSCPSYRSTAKPNYQFRVVLIFDLKKQRTLYNKRLLIHFYPDKGKKCTGIYVEK